MDIDGSTLVYIYIYRIFLKISGRKSLRKSYRFPAGTVVVGWWLYGVGMAVGWLDGGCMVGFGKQLKGRKSNSIKYRL